MTKTKKKTKKNKPIKCFVASLELFPYDALVSLNQTDKEFKKELLNRLDKKDIKKYMYKVGNAQAYYINMEGKGSIIRIYDFDYTNPVNIGTLVHEISHFVHKIYHNIGIEWCKESDEAFSYAIGYLTTTILEKAKE